MNQMEEASLSSAHQPECLTGGEGASCGNAGLTHGR